MWITLALSLLSLQATNAINAAAYNAWWNAQQSGSSLPAPEVDCDWILPDAGLARKSVTVLCPANCLDVAHCVRVKGSSTYTVHSPVCLAAIHSGVINAQKGGGVDVVVIEGQQKYSASLQNGVASVPYGRYFASFKVKKSDVSCKPTPTVAPCVDQALLDLVFVADSSLSVGPNDFKAEMNFISDIAGIFKIGPTQTRVGLEVFNTFSKTKFRLETHKSRSALQSALKAVKFESGGTYIGKALWRVTRDMKFRKDKNVQKIVIVFTDGRSMDSVRRPVAALRKAGVEMVAFGVADVKDKTLLELADGKKDHVFSAKSFADLKNYMGSLVTRICAFVMAAQHSNYHH